ncbi:hypothetical protein KIL84_006196 [Mauremys mutica]|uniref:Uncharacterized protein n=1 Tax=Mauremys mutica TaxID=74926 RepID=A0A9D4ATU0_9SAUR|nr:hypothetical protein KIL84_006196 [Mauremys mutica]
MNVCSSDVLAQFMSLNQVRIRSRWRTKGWGGLERYFCSLRTPPNYHHSILLRLQLQIEEQKQKTGNILVNPQLMLFFCKYPTYSFPFPLHYSWNLELAG